jgi:hypothetical protein
MKGPCNVGSAGVGSAELEAGEDTRQTTLS